MRIVERINRVLYKVNKLSLLFQILVIAFLLCGCAGAGDWASEPLVANYEIWRLSGHDIELVKRTGESSASTIIEEEVYAVAWDDNYIFVQHETMEPDKEDYTKEPHGELDYYIFVVSSEEVLGPFTRSKFEETCVSRNYPLPQEWIQVRTLPRQ